MKTQEKELEYYQTVKIDEEAFAESSKEFQKLSNQPLSDEDKRAFGIATVKAGEAEHVHEDEDSYSPATYEYVIATLDICLMGRFKDKKFKTDTDLRKFISDVYGELNGISVSNLNHVIAASRRRLKKTHDPRENELEILSRYNL